MNTPNGLDTVPGLTEILGRRTQLGMVVRDLEETANYWATHLGVGPWIVIGSTGADRTFVHRGIETDVKTKMAFSYTGETQIELIEQTNTAMSPYTEFLDSGHEGLHHLGFWPDDFAASCSALEQAGFEELCAVYFGDGTKNVAYYTSPPAIGVILELAPMTPFRSRYMSAIERLAANWDGSRPVRRYDSREQFIASDDFVSVQT